MLTDFGRYLRKMRIDCGEIIKDMAEKLNVTASFLSAVETGKKNIPDHWINTLANLYCLNENAKQELLTAAENSVRSVKLDLELYGGERRETAILFAREFESIYDETISQIRNLLKKNGREDF